MKYLWIVVLVIGCILWSIYSVLDIIYCFKTYQRGYRLSALHCPTCVWIATTVSCPVIYSFYLWLQ